MTTINDLLDRYQSEELAHLGRRTQVDYVRFIEKLRVLWGDRDPETIKPRELGQYMDVRTGRLQRGKILMVLKNCYRLGVGKWFTVENNPFHSLVMPKSNPRKRYVTDEEFYAVRSICRPRVQAIMDLALLTGQRQGDILDLRWDNIDVNDRVIYVRQGKTGKLFGIAITEELEEVLVRCKRMEPALPRDYVVRTRTGERYSSEGFRALWNRFMKKAVRDGVIKEGFRFHDIRAKCASDSGSVADASKLLGHQDERITSRVYDRSIRIVQPLR